MRCLKKGICLALACVFCAVPAHAETYREIALTAPTGIGVEDQPISFSVDENRLDLIVNKNGKGSIRHCRSEDGGKTWKDLDVSWLSEVGEGDSRKTQLGVRKDGTIYGVSVRKEPVDLPAFSYKYCVGTVFTHKDGVTRMLCKLDDQNYLSYEAVGTSLWAEGDIALNAWGLDQPQYLGKTTPSRVLTIDPATGREKASAPYSGRYSTVAGYENGVLWKYEGDSVTLLDAATGKVTQTVKRPAGTDWFGTLWTSANGAFYELNGNGLFRLKPGEKDWTKLLDSSVCKKGTAGSSSTSCQGLAVDEKDGSVTVLLAHTAKEGTRGGLALKEWTLTRYVPGS